MVSFTDCGRAGCLVHRVFSKHESGWTNGKKEWLLGGLSVCDGVDLGGLVPLMAEPVYFPWLDCFHALANHVLVGTCCSYLS